MQKSYTWAETVTVLPTCTFYVGPRGIINGGKCIRSLLNGKCGGALSRVYDPSGKRLTVIKYPLIQKRLWCLDPFLKNAFGRLFDTHLQDVWCIFLYQREAPIGDLRQVFSLSWIISPYQLPSSI